MSVSEEKICQNCKNQFTIEPDDFSFYETIHVPPPTFCPRCRLVRRHTWRNVFTLYRRPCDLCKKEVFSVYAPDKSRTVYCSPCWWSDQWEASQYGRDYDFSKPFFEQFAALLHEAPLLGRFVLEDTLVNSDYTNMVNDLKDCYLIFTSRLCERAAYSDNLFEVKDSLDLSYSTRSELCYECFNVRQCYKLYYSIDSEACHDSYFLKDCVGCSNCFGCAGLRNQNYSIFNKQYTKESYLQELERLGFVPDSARSVEHFEHESEKIWNSVPVKYFHGSRTTNVSGDYLYNSKNIRSCFFATDVENSKYCAYLMFGNPVKDSYDFTQYGDGGELIYECLQSGRGVYGNRFGWCIWTGTKNCEYGVLNIDSSDCFGCVGVKKKQYFILNKQYSKEEFFALREKIVKQMEELPYRDRQGNEYRYGEFFPTELSPFAYNETSAQDEFPLTKADAEAQGHTWNDNARPQYVVTKSAGDLPDRSDQADGNLSQEVIGCAVCGRGYRLTPSELEFYRRNKIPLPRSCFYCRTEKRTGRKTSQELFPRLCQCAGLSDIKSQYRNLSQHFHGAGKCPNEFETSYAPDRPEIVYCEQCYNAEVV